MTTSSNDTPKLLKNFIYLDEAKLNSFVSQIFSGTTEYVLSTSEQSSAYGEDQKGEVLSGKILKAIFSDNESKLEKKFLYDHSYLIFEEHLQETQAIAHITENTEYTHGQSRFVKIKGKIKFIDISVILDTLENFSELQEAFTLVTEWEGVKSRILKESESGKNKGKVKKVLEQYKELVSAQAGVDKDYYKQLRKVLSFGYRDMFAVQAKIGKKLYTAEIKRQYLREEEQFLIRKYSRLSEKDFIIIGTVASNHTQVLSENIMAQEGFSDKAMRRSLFNLIEQFSRFEQTMLGNLEDEVIIDPIAIYCEI